MTTSQASKGKGKGKPVDLTDVALTADDMASLLATAEGVTAAAKATTVTDARWSHFGAQLRAMAAHAAMLVAVIGARLAGEATGYAMHTEATTPGRKGYVTDKDTRKALGQESNYTRCVQVAAFDAGWSDEDGADNTATNRAKYRKQGNAANVQDFIAWCQIMQGTATAATLAKWNVTEVDGMKVAKRKPVTSTPRLKVTTPLTKLIADGADVWNATLALPGFDVSRLPADQIDAIAARLVATIMLRDAAKGADETAPASDDDALADVLTGS